MEGRKGRRRHRLAGGPSPEQSAARLFFALWPDDATRLALGRLARALHEQCGGRQVREQNIHLTLVFLGAVPAGLAPALVRMAEETHGESFHLALDKLEYWRHNHIVCVGTTRCPAALRDLCARLAKAADSLGIRTEARDYVPHITLLRKAERPPSQPDFGSIEWRIGEFALMQSLARPGGVAYEMIGRWELAVRDAAVAAGDQPAA